MNQQPKAGVIPTEFVTEEQTAELDRILELALEDTDDVSGGLSRAGSTCSCVNCCSHARLM